MKSIFVSVVSYRDTDLQNTVDDLFAKAADPSRVFVGVYLQIDNELDQDCLIRPRPNLRVETIDAKDAKGAGYARSKVQALWRGEDYFFQVDSHMRFIQGWDEILIDMHGRCPSKSVISTYPLPFTPPNTFNKDMYVVIKPKCFDTDGVLLQNSGMFPFTDQRLEQSAFVSAGMLFGPASIITEVPYDPHIFFTGEEIMMGVRLWTHGYDIYIPNEAVAYHNYNLAPERPRIWKDVATQTKMSADSRARVLWFLGTKEFVGRDSLVEIDRYGLGKVRTLAEYEKFSELDFKNMRYRGLNLGKSDIDAK